MVTIGFFTLRDFLCTLACFILLFSRPLGWSQAGQIDYSFFAGAALNGEVECVAVQTDGKIVIGGKFDTVHGVRRNRIARLHSDGSLDETFTPAIGTDVYVLCLLIQPDGKIVAGGSNATTGNPVSSMLMRLNPDGTNDSSFNIGTGPNGIVECVRYQSDGSLIIGGTFQAVNGASVNAVARLNSSGALDQSFTTALGSSDTVYDIAIQPDGKVITVGSFRNSEANFSRVARWWPDGSADSDFKADVSSGSNQRVKRIELQSDGKLLIVGSFSLAGSTADRRNFARLNADGSIDSTFTIDPGAVGSVNCLAIQKDGRILLGGDFNMFNGQLVSN